MTRLSTEILAKVDVGDLIDAVVRHGQYAEVCIAEPFRWANWADPMPLSMSMHVQRLPAVDVLKAALAYRSQASEEEIRSLQEERDQLAAALHDKALRDRLKPQWTVMDGRVVQINADGSRSVEVTLRCNRVPQAVRALDADPGDQIRIIDGKEGRA